MPVDSVDNYTIFRVIHSIAFRSSVFCSADKVREVVETRFFESYRQMFKTGFDISSSPDCKHLLLFFRAYPESYFAKTFFFAVFLFCLYRAKDGFCKRFRVFLFKSYCGFINIIHGVI